MYIIRGADAETHMCPKRGIMCFSFMCPQIGIHSNVADNNGYVHSCPIAGLNGYECTFAIRKVLPAPWCRQECVFSFRKVLERLFVSTCMVKVRCSSAFVKYSFASEIEWDCHKTLNREKTHIKTLWECHFGAKLDGMDRLFDEHEW